MLHYTQSRRRILIGRAVALALWLIVTGSSRGSDVVWTTGGPLAAPVTALAIDPGDPLRVYAAATDSADSTSHAYRSEDGGESWVELARATEVVAGLQVDNPTTGRLYGVTRTIFYRSDDDGLSWSSLWRFGVQVATLFKAPNRGQLFVMGGRCECFRWPCLIGLVCTRVLLRSDDGGESWRDLRLEASAVAADPSQPGLLYAAAKGVLYRTDDDGDHWHRVAALPLERCGDVNSLAVSAADGGLIYAGFGGSWASCGGVFISADSGQTWNRSSLSPRYVTTVIVDPAAPPTVYAGSGPSSAGLRGGGVARSLDGGITWAEFSQGMEERSVSDLVIDRSGSFVYAATDAGVYRVQARRGGPPPSRRPRTPVIVPPRSAVP